LIQHRLRNLPRELAQPYDWTEFRRRARERAAAVARRDANARTTLAVAAALVLAVVGIAIWMRFTRSGGPPDIAGYPMAETDWRVFEGDAGSVSGTDARANAAERWLASLPTEPVVVRVGTRAAVTGLEDRIAQLDDYLSAARVAGVQPAKLVDVEAQRALLVRSLVQVRYAETLVSASR